MKIHADWGVNALKSKADIIVIVDTIIFSTTTTMTTERDVQVFPFLYNETARAFAQKIQIQIANKRSEGGLSLSPPSLAVLGAGDQIILPSGNGARLSLFADAPIVLIGCLRNSSAVAEFINQSNANEVQFVAVGASWKSKTKNVGTLRPAVEDWLACGAIINQLSGVWTAEAAAAAATFSWAEPNLHKLMRACQSGQELIERGFGQDVDCACELSVTECVPILRELDKAYGDFGVTDSELRARRVKYYEASRGVTK